MTMATKSPTSSRSCWVRIWTLTKLPATTKVLDEVAAEEDPGSKPAKDFFHRDRPWVVDTSLTPCVTPKPTQAHASYPSGHATRSYSMGIVLASLVPDKAQAILARSAEFAENRLVCGMHFRSDIVAGQELGTVIALSLMENAAFKADFDAARAELARARMNKRPIFQSAETDLYPRSGHIVLDRHAAAMQFGDGRHQGQSQSIALGGRLRSRRVKRRKTVSR